MQDYNFLKNSMGTLDKRLKKWYCMFSTQSDRVLAQQNTVCKNNVKGGSCDG